MSCLVAMTEPTTRQSEHHRRAANSKAHSVLGGAYKTLAPSSLLLPVGHGGQADTNSTQIVLLDRTSASSTLSGAHDLHDPSAGWQAVRFLSNVRVGGDFVDGR